MKRVLPLLGRIAPMLETYVAARGATRADTEAIDRLQSELKAQGEAGTLNHTDLKKALEAHGNSLSQLSEQVQQLRADERERFAQMQAMEAQTAQNARLLRAFGLLATLLLFVLGGMLIALLRRH